MRQPGCNHLTRCRILAYFGRLQLQLIVHCSHKKTNHSSTELSFLHHPPPRARKEIDTHIHFPSYEGKKYQSTIRNRTKDPVSKINIEQNLHPSPSPRRQNSPPAQETQAITAVLQPTETLPNQVLPPTSPCPQAPRLTISTCPPHHQ